MRLADDMYLCLCVHAYICVYAVLTCTDRVYISVVGLAYTYTDAPLRSLHHIQIEWTRAHVHIHKHAPLARVRLYIRIIEQFMREGEVLEGSQRLCRINAGLISLSEIIE